MRRAFVSTDPVGSRLSTVHAFVMTQPRWMLGRHQSVFPLRRRSLGHPAWRGTRASARELRLDLVRARSADSRCPAILPAATSSAEMTGLRFGHPDLELPRARSLFLWRSCRAVGTKR